MRSTETDSVHWYSRPVVIAGIGIIVVASALLLTFFRRHEEASVGEPPAVSAPAPIGAQAPPSVSAAGSASFDVARISRDGDTVIAGRAAPGATVIIAANGEPIGTVTADGRGEWVYVPEAPLPPGAHRLTLATKNPGEAMVEGKGEVLIVVPAPGKDIGGRGGPMAGRPLALLIPKDDTPPTVLQKPGEETEIPARLVIDVVDYDENGRLAIGGRARPGAEVRVTLDDRPVGSTVANAKGAWALTSKRLALTDNHVLKADEIDAQGRPAGRFVGRLLLAEPKASARPAAGSIVVEPGQNLWRIARRTYGEGYSYTIIYEANRGKIGDPDLIYPGQVFALPAGPGAGRRWPDGKRRRDHE